MIAIPPARRRLALLVLSAAAVLLLGGCAGGRQLRTSDPAGAQAVATPSPGAVTPATTAPATGGSAGGTGSLTLAMTQPKALSTTAAAAVTCSVLPRRYVVTATDVAAEDLNVTLRATIPGYNGPGNYQAQVLLTVVQPGASALGGAVAGVPLTVESDDNGSFAYSYTGPQGRTLATSVNWDCSD